MTEDELRTLMAELAVDDDPNIIMGKIGDMKGLSSWERNQLAIRKHAAAERPRNFLKWSTIQKTMFVGNAPYIKGEYEEISLRPRDWLTYIKEPWFGRPVRSDLNPLTSGNYIHQAYFLSTFEFMSSVDTEHHNSIFEFGGGYGALCYIIHKLGFMGSYQLYDLPEMQIIQQYYLSNTIGGGIDVSWEDEIPSTEIDLFIANASISEVNRELRDKIFATINAKHYYISYLYQFDGINNVDYFNELKEKTQGVIDWQSRQNPHKSNIIFLYGVRI